MSSIKEPACYDTSHHNIVPDFTAIRPRPFLMITKASEGTLFTDPTFTAYMQGIKSAGYRRGCYHFNRQAYKGADQARHFLKVIEPVVDADDLLVLDVEEEPAQENAHRLVSEMWMFLETVRANHPKNMILIYSRASVLNLFPMTEAEKHYFRTKVPLWVAGYPLDPDKYSSIPLDLIPDPQRWGPVYLWQYSETGLVTGIPGKTDCNWISPILQVILAAPINPPTEEEQMHQGMTNQNPTKIFSAPAGGQVDQFPQNTTVQGDAPVGEWAFIRSPKSGYVKLIHLTNYKPLPVTPPPPPVGPALANTIYVYKDGSVKVVPAG